MTVAELTARMTSAEMTEWQAYFDYKHWLESQEQR